MKKILFIVCILLSCSLLCATEVNIKFINFENNLILVVDGERVIHSSPNLELTIHDDSIYVKNESTDLIKHTFASLDPLYISLKHKGEIYFKKLDLSKGLYIYMVFDNDDVEVYYFQEGARFGIF